MLAETPSFKCLVNYSITFWFSLTKHKFELLKFKQWQVQVSSKLRTLYYCTNHMSMKPVLLGDRDFFVKQYSVVVKSESDCQTLRPSSLTFF